MFQSKCTTKKSLNWEQFFYINERDKCFLIFIWKWRFWVATEECCFVVLSTYWVHLRKSLEILFCGTMNQVSQSIANLEQSNRTNVNDSKVILFIVVIQHVSSFQSSIFTQMGICTFHVPYQFISLLPSWLLLAFHCSSPSSLS